MLLCGHVDVIRNGVLRFRTEVFPAKREIYENLAEKQVPFALFITCGDSRIDPCLLTGTEPGQIFVDRTPGNIVPAYDEIASVGVSASIEYAVTVLGVHDVIVCGHSACEGAASSGSPGESTSNRTLAEVCRTGVETVRAAVWRARRVGAAEKAHTTQCLRTNGAFEDPSSRPRASQHRNSDCSRVVL